MQMNSSNMQAGAPAQKKNNTTFNHHCRGGGRVIMLLFDWGRSFCLFPLCCRQGLVQYQ